LNNLNIVIDIIIAIVATVLNTVRYWYRIEYGTVLVLEVEIPWLARATAPASVKFICLLVSEDRCHRHFKSPILYYKIRIMAARMNRLIRHILYYSMRIMAAGFIWYN